MHTFIPDSPAIRAYFEKHGQRLEYDKRQTLVRVDDPQPWVYFLEDGIVEASYAFPDGVDRMLGYFVPNSIFAQNRSFFDDAGGDLKYLTITKTVILRVHRDDFLKQVAKVPKFNQEYLQMALLFRIFTTDLVIYLGENRIHNRCVRWLMLMARYYGEQTDEGVRIMVPLTQDTIANFLHVSRESISKTLREFTKGGHITIRKKQITIKNVDGLKDLLEY